MTSLLSRNFYTEDLIVQKIYFKLTCWFYFCRVKPTLLLVQIMEKLPYSIQFLQLFKTSDVPFTLPVQEIECTLDFKFPLWFKFPLRASTQLSDIRNFVAGTWKTSTEQKLSSSCLYFIIYDRYLIHWLHVSATQDSIIHQIKRNEN